MKKLRVVGLNFDHMHMGDLLRQCHEHPEVEIAGICDTDPARMRAAIGHFAIPPERVFTDPHRCLAATEPDFVILCPATAEHADYFHGGSARPGLRVVRSGGLPAEASVEAWSDDPRGLRVWTVAGGTAGMAVEQVLMELAPDAGYRLRCGDGETAVLRSDHEGRLRVRARIEAGTSLRFELDP